MARRAEQGFSLLEVLIAMSILAVGAASILSIFVWAIGFHSKRHEENRLTGLYNHVLTHARAAFDEFDPGLVAKGQPLVPKPIVAVLDRQAAGTSPDLMIRDAARKYPGYKYTITFEENDLAVPGSSVVVEIEIFGLSGQRAYSDKQFLTRTGAPLSERFRSPSLESRGQEPIPVGRGPG
jgi:prepilin-type N-terminal cleavage/methylation domain-containing protein